MRARGLILWPSGNSRVRRMHLAVFAKVGYVTLCGRWGFLTDRSEYVTCRTCQRRCGTASPLDEASFLLGY